MPTPARPARRAGDGLRAATRRLASRLVPAAASTRAPGRRLPTAVSAYLAYQALVLAVVGAGVVTDPTGRVVGSSPYNDVAVMVWALRWWPWAISHGVNPFHTDLVWAPTGYVVAWMTSIPAASLAAWPVTATLGPVAAYNLLMLLAPALAATSAFALCRRVTGQPPAALLGGLVFGFSPYVFAQTAAQHLNLVMVFPLPLLVLVVVRFVERDITPRRFVLLAAALVGLLFGLSMETCFTASVLGGLVLAALIIIDRERRPRLLAAARCLVAAYVAVGVVMAPFIYGALAGPHPPLPYQPGQFAADAANFIAPTQLTVGGWLDAAQGLTRHMAGNIGEQGAYLGLPLLAVCLFVVVSERRRTRGRVLGLALLIAGLFSLGPVVRAAGRDLFNAPWYPTDAPVVRYVLPMRMVVYATLAAAVALSVWAARPAKRGARLTAATLVACSLVPNIAWAGWPPPRHADTTLAMPAHGWTAVYEPPALFSDASLNRYVRLGENLLVLPFGPRTAVYAWQAESDMAFRLTSGYTPGAPAAYASEPLIGAFLADRVPSRVLARLRCFLIAHHVQAVVTLGISRGVWDATFTRTLRAQPWRVGAADVFRVPSSFAAARRERCPGSAPPPDTS